MPADPAASPWRGPYGRLLATIALGSLGGLVFFYLRVPLAWMIGAMLTTTAASVSGARLHVPGGLRVAMIMVLGVLLGSAFRPEILARAAQWPLTLAALALYLTLATATLFVYFRRVLGFDVVTAYFSATPGGLNEMTITGASFGGDDRTIALVHASRVLLLVLIIPLWFRYHSGVSSTAAAARGVSLFDTPWLDLAVLTACAVVGMALARAARLPAYRLVGPMLASAAVHLLGWTRSAPPLEVIAVAQIVVGAAIGARFVGVPLRRLVRTILASLGSTTLVLTYTVAFSFVLAQVTEFEVAPLVLAFAPGGLSEMSLIALALGVETAFVATHHVARIAMIVIVAPFVFRWLRRRRR